MEQENIDLDDLIDMLVVDKLDIMNAIAECEIEDTVDEDELIEMLEEKGILRCNECGLFENEDDFEYIHGNKVCPDCAAESFDENDEDEDW